MSAQEPPRARIRNWRKFQHYTDRNPPWIKLHFEILSSRDWVMLDDASRVLAIACMLIGSRNAGEVPMDPEYFRRVAYLNTVDFNPLIEVGFIEISQADASACKQMLADARPETETETETETEFSSSSVIPQKNIVEFALDPDPECASRKRKNGATLENPLDPSKPFQSYPQAAEYVLGRLNDTGSRQFRFRRGNGKLSSHAEAIVSVLKAGYSVRECCAVIARQWGSMSPEEAAKWFTPTTLFRLRNFERTLDNWEGGKQ